MPSVKLIELGDITWNLCHAIKEFGYREGIQEGQTHFQGNSKPSMMIQMRKGKMYMVVKAFLPSSERKSWLQLRPVDSSRIQPNEPF